MPLVPGHQHLRPLLWEVRWPPNGERRTETPVLVDPTQKAVVEFFDAIFMALTSPQDFGNLTELRLVWVPF